MLQQAASKRESSSHKSSPATVVKSKPTPVAGHSSSSLKSSPATTVKSKPGLPPPPVGGHSSNSLKSSPATVVKSKPTPVAGHPSNSSRPSTSSAVQMADADSTSKANTQVSAVAGKRNRKSFESRNPRKKSKLDTSVKKDASAVTPLMSIFIPKTTGVLQRLMIDMCQIIVILVCLLYKIALRYGKTTGYELEMGQMSDYDIRPKPKVWAGTPNECKRSAELRPNVVR